ncbi:hypothetical protein BDB00DRAFT_924655 [Zychaea mexicana]|uniref:uncharacterized protein n=1 Tax=Zychaea mexicana TaxID=64656 RepID=UPI0022FE6D96|nr:uncharacterized protein BDB00DRAFT_924655 [Zychaea mexicana]KAI9498836.1 hypothetical protein BDB00DRAFT_924655 [Zychaea mexicana]
MTLSPSPYARKATSRAVSITSTSSSSKSSAASAGPFHPHSSSSSRQQYSHAAPIISSSRSQGNYSPSLSAIYQKPHHTTPISSSSDLASVVSNSSDAISELTTSAAAHRSNSLPEMSSVSSHQLPHQHETSSTRPYLAQRQQYTQLLYAGDVVLHENPDTNKLQLLPMRKSKKVFLVLTDTCLLHFKSAAKAHLAGIEISFNTSASKDRQQQQQYPAIRSAGKGALVVASLSDVYAVHIVNTIAESYTFRIDFTADDDTKRATAVVGQVSTATELRQWIMSLRKATRTLGQHVSNATMQRCLSPSERYATIDRIRKHNDVQEDMAMFKVVYKEKRRQSTNDLVPKDAFVTVIFAIGKYSFYLLPSSSSSGGMLTPTIKETSGRSGKSSSSRKTAAVIIASSSLSFLERDRYGLLAISEIEYDDQKDDTFRLLVRQVNKPLLQIALVSNSCEVIIQRLRQAMDSLAPIRTTYTLRLPDHLMNSAVVALSSASSYYHQAVIVKAANHDDPGYDEQFLQFELLLHAHCAALNLNKSRFFYDVSGPLDAKKLLLLPPNAVSQSADTYSKHELVALLRCLWHNPFFKEIVFANHSLEELDSWAANNQDGWAMHPRDISAKSSNSVLANELYALFVDTPLLAKIDLTNCRVGYSNAASKISSLASIGTALQQNGRLNQICIGKNQMSASDIQELVNGLHASKGLTHLDIHDMSLHARQIEQILSTLLSYSPERLTYLDVSYGARSPSVSPGLIEAILERCTQLQVLRLKGHHDLQFGELIFKCQPTLVELDMSQMQHTNDDILQLTQWIQSSSFSSSSSSSSGSGSGSTSTSSTSSKKIATHVLRLDDCGLHGGHLGILMKAIHPSGNVHLSFNGNPVLKDVVHLPKLFPVFMHSTRGPTSLALGRIEWEENSLRELFDCLQDNQVLTCLDLAESGFVLGTEDLSHDTVRVLTRLFERNTMLKELTFRSSAPLLGKAITQALHGLKSNRSLERLDLTGLGLGDAGIQALANVLQHNRTLQALEIDSNWTTIRGFRDLTTAIPKSGLIELSRPYKDLRYQLQTLRETIAGLIQSENEMQWFIIHSTQASETRRTRAQLQMQNQTRRSAEASYSKITGVVNKMMQVVEENHKQYQVEQRHIRAMRLQAEYAAEELAIAQLRLQSDTSMASHHVGSRYTYSSIDSGATGNISSRSASVSTIGQGSAVSAGQSTTAGYHITQSPLPSPPPPWTSSSSPPLPAFSSSTSTSTTRHQHHHHDSGMSIQLTPAEYQYNTYPLTPASTRRSSTPEEYIGHYEEAVSSDIAPPAAPAAASTIVLASSSLSTPTTSAAPPRRTSNATTARRVTRRRHATEPTVNENYDHPGFVDDFRIIVRQELGSIARHQHQQHPY